MLSDGATSFLCGVLVLRPFVGELMLKRQVGGPGTQLHHSQPRLLILKNLPSQCPLHTRLSRAWLRNLQILFFFFFLNLFNISFPGVWNETQVRTGSVAQTWVSRCRDRTPLRPLVARTMCTWPSLVESPGAGGPRQKPGVRQVSGGGR